MESAFNKKHTPVIGVIAEYNPFHNGHALHLAKARKALASINGTWTDGAWADAPVVVTLSSSFTQRGLPAFAGKMARTQMALANGASLVLELPFVHACSSAQEFARGAVGILAAAGVVTHLAFGVENASAFTQKTFIEEETAIVLSEEPLFEKLLNILIQEPLSFKLSLRENLAAGCSYPKAIALALDSQLPGSGGLVSSPNNALAVSYMAAIKRGGHSLIPIPVQREGSGHGDETAGRIASAAAIRKALSREAREDGGWTKSAMPPSVTSILEEELNSGRLCLSTGKLWDLLRGLLVRSTPESLRACAGMEEGIENLFLKHFAKAGSYEDFIGRCVCARYTRGRLQRQVIRCLSGLDRWTAGALTRSGPQYIRVLGYDERGRQLLRERKKLSGAVPVITRLSAARCAIAQKAADAEFRASRLRELLLPNPDLTSEEKIIPLAK